VYNNTVVADAAGAAVDTAIECRYLSEKERLKGNECFKSNENDQAYIHYTKSIAFGYIGMQKHTAATAAADMAYAYGTVEVADRCAELDR
jgi:hypothetical protein